MTQVDSYMAYRGFHTKIISWTDLIIYLMILTTITLCGGVIYKVFSAVTRPCHTISNTTETKYELELFCDW